MYSNLSASYTAGCLGYIHLLGVRQPTRGAAADLWVVYQYARGTADGGYSDRRECRAHSR